MLERFVPQPRLTQVDHVDVAVPARQAYDVARHLDMARAPLVRALFALRSIPARLRGHEEGPQRLAIDDITGEGSAFRMLAEEPGHGFVVGAIGRFWKSDIEWATVAPEGFARFAEAGWGRVAWSIIVEPRGDQAARVSVALRVDATDDESWRALHRYFRLIGPFSHLIRREMLRRLEAELGSEREAEVRPWQDVGSGIVGALGMLFDLATPFLRGVRNRWGLDAETSGYDYPGDEHIPAPKWQWTHGIEIDAPAADVWQWVAQIGVGRAGFYSYQWLENLVGCDVQNADRIHPEWRMRAGDSLRLHPKMPPMHVVELEDGRWLVALGGGTADEPEHIAATWLFYVAPLSPTRCRFISRFRVGYAAASKRGRRMFGPYLTEAIGFVMDRRMLLGVKERAERITQGSRP